MKKQIGVDSFMIMWRIVVIYLILQRIVWSMLHDKATRSSLQTMTQKIPTVSQRSQTSARANGALDSTQRNAFILAKSSSSTMETNRNSNLSPDLPRASSIPTSKTTPHERNKRKSTTGLNAPPQLLQNKTAQREIPNLSYIISYHITSNHIPLQQLFIISACWAFPFQIPNFQI